ncbi:MAG: hypothetical protein IPI44_07680 [Sulfuritalea sp.]|nr:hypothetical protein [Sulfuritalea sp.]
MLVQHILTEEIFSKVFDSEFHPRQQHACELYQPLSHLFTGGPKKKTLKGLEAYYAAIRAAARSRQPPREAGLPQGHLREFLQLMDHRRSRHNIEQYYPTFAAEHPELPLAMHTNVQCGGARLLQGRPGLSGRPSMPTCLDYAQVRRIQQTLPSDNDKVAGVPNCSVAGDSIKPT